MKFINAWRGMNGIYCFTGFNLWFMKASDFNQMKVGIMILNFGIEFTF